MNKFNHFLMCFLSVLSPKLNFGYRYWRKFGKKMNLSAPSTFNEKIIWLELNKYVNDSLVIKCADKYNVREYVRDCGCGEILIPCIGVWDTPKKIEWDTLPDKFVLKWNFGAGFNYICTEKSACSKEAVLEKMQKWGNSKYWLWYGEMHYKRIPPKIICEEYISGMGSDNDEKEHSPEDYKFYCINGKVKYVLVCRNRKGMHADYVFFDTNWNVQPFSSYAREQPEKIRIQRPAMIDTAIEYAERLAMPFPCVRVDLYILRDRIYFGELTFTPCGGVDNDICDGDIIMGNLLDISNC